MRLILIGCEYVGKTTLANNLRDWGYPLGKRFHMDDGDFVVVKNIENIKFTGKKFKNKKYYRHTGHPGGIKEITPENLHKKKPGEALKLAVKRMLPGGPLAKKQLTKLKMYSGNEHPHSAQNFTVIELAKLNNKNLLRN